MICPLCNSVDIEPVKAYVSKNPFFKDSEICRCSTCTMQMINPLPFKDEWESFNESYFINAHGGLTSSRWVECYNIGVAKIRLKALMEYLFEENMEVNSLLEVGPGLGYLMREFKNKQPNTKYYVIESDSSVHRTLEAEGAIIVNSRDIKNIPPVDIVVATHVLEHAIDPVGFLQQFIERLKPGGAVFIETPCLDHEYKEIHEPHVLFFEKSTLSRCMESCGLQDIKLTYNGDKISNLRRNAFIRKCLVNLERRFKFPFHWFLGQYWADQKLYSLTQNETLAIAETSPHIEQKCHARWVRGFGKKTYDQKIS